MRPLNVVLNIIRKDPPYMILKNSISGLGRYPEKVIPTQDWPEPWATAGILTKGSKVQVSEMRDTKYPSIGSCPAPI
jgi:hypothetical protein